MDDAAACRVLTCNWCLPCLVALNTRVCACACLSVCRSVRDGLRFALHAIHPSIHHVSRLKLHDSPSHPPYDPCHVCFIFLSVCLAVGPHTRRCGPAARTCVPPFGRGAVYKREESEREAPMVLLHLDFAVCLCLPRVCLLFLRLFVSHLS